MVAFQIKFRFLKAKISLADEISRERLTSTWSKFKTVQNNYNE